MALRFGNIGLAAAAYNAGPARVENWLMGNGSLARETHAYVLSLTGHAVEDWAQDRHGEQRVLEPVDRTSCIAVVASLRVKQEGHGLELAPNLAFEGNFLTAIAMVRFEKVRQRYCLRLDPHWRIGSTRQATASEDFLPPLCSTYRR
jgi:hypothetical protein